jgi:2,3-dihydroxybenzoate-AMP ligase
MNNDLVGWPEDVAQSYVESGYWRGRPLGWWMWTYADTFGERTAIVDGDIRMTYRELAERADALAVGLHSRGLQPGDTVLVQLPNCWEFVVLTFACFRIGVIPIMALPAHREVELRGLAEHGRAKAIVVPDNLRGFDHQELACRLATEIPRMSMVFTVGSTVSTQSSDLRAMMHPVDPVQTRESLDAEAPSSRDVALFLLSGGTTGLPKLIPRTHDDYEYNARRSGEVCQFDESTVYLVVLPAAHNFALACPGILGTLLVGGRIVLLGSPDPAASFAAIETERVTVAAVVPAVAQRWIDAAATERSSTDADADISSLALLQVGGSRLAPEVAVRIEPTLGCKVQQVFGMAEGLLNYTTLDDPADVVRDTQGRPMSEGDEVMIVDDNDEPVPTGEMGLLLTRGPYTIRGYYDASEHNKLAFTRDGWYRTGDVVRMHPSGNLVVEGRAKDIINRSGEKISAEEVENMVYTIAGVAQTAAVAVPDPDVGERICVFVVMYPGKTAPTLSELRAELSNLGAARFKLPEQLEVVTELPLTNVGKIDKKRLRDDLKKRVVEAPENAAGTS